MQIRHEACRDGGFLSLGRLPWNQVHYSIPTTGHRIMTCGLNSAYITATDQNLTRVDLGNFVSAGMTWRPVSDYRVGDEIRRATNGVIDIGGVRTDAHRRYEITPDQDITLRKTGQGNDDACVYVEFYNKERMN
ncbi:hypothetical protein M8J76_016209 [Diaphorina citri]|nr:hypothetical protein M8J76_016209 [Diaphorina citri]